MVHSNKLILTEFFSADEIKEIRGCLFNNLKGEKIPLPWKFIKRSLELNPESYHEFIVLLRGFIKYRSNLTPKLKEAYLKNIEKYWINLATMWRTMINFM